MKSVKAPWCIAANLLMAYVCYTVCRIAFLLCNWNLFGNDLTASSFFTMMKGGLMFDTAAIFYTNILYLLIVAFPLHFKEIAIVRKAGKWIFVVVNSLAIVLNLIDCVYYPFSHHRSSLLEISEFENNTNLGTIFAIEFVNHWYLVVLAALLIWALWRFHIQAAPLQKNSSLIKYYLRHTLTLLVFAAIAVIGIRGGVTTAIRPLAVSNAYQYVSRSLETGIVLNTPFCIIRISTIDNVEVPAYYASQEELDKEYNPIHTPCDSIVERRKNVVIIIVESFAHEFVGALNTDLDNGTYKGYTTFTDSLINQSLTWRNAFANGSLSIDAIPSVMLSVPEMENAFALCPYATNDVAGIATHLGSIGYESAFFHGAENSSMGFQAIAKAAGFAKYYGRENYEQEDFMGGKKDFDGTWAIWDEEFLQYTCSKISKMKEPFVSGIFTASSHHPFTLPEKYKNVYPEEGKYPLHKCIRYTDNALRLFFASASRQPWYKNTIFVITADHASTKITHKEYNNEVGLFKIPIIFFDPSGEMPRQIVDGVAQQIDIMPTILNYLGYNKPYIAFGNDLLSTPPDKSWAFVWDNGLPQYFQGEYVIQYQGDSIAKAYNFVTDPTLKHNIKGSFPQQPEMDRKAKAIMQSVLSREAGNQMVISD